MGHVNLPAKRSARQWKLLDLVSAAFFIAVFLFFVLVFTPLGDSIAASGRQALVLSMSDPKQRARLLSLVELGQKLEACSSEAVDHMPCEDPRRNSQLSREMNFYRERHCPMPEETPLCLIPPPDGYRIPISWPESMHKIWHSNMPHNKIAERKGHQGWMKEEGPHFVFPGGGTMFPDGAVSYIEKLGQYIPISGGVLRTALDMGCGVASFGGYLLKEDILALSFAPRDSHKSQIQFALERGIPAFVAMLGTRRLPFPAHSFDLVHCSRCLIPFTAYNGTYFVEVDRLLRPGGYLVISGPPVQWAKLDKEWADLQAVARALCYELIVVDGNTVIWKKPSGDSCLPNQNEFGLDLCSDSDDPNDGWYYGLKNCISKLLSLQGENAVGVIPKWPGRLAKSPARVKLIKNGNDVFEADTRRWARRVAYYKKSLDLKLGTPAIRNVMDMNAFFGGFAAAINSDPVWVMNVVPARKLSTLGIIYDRGLIGVYHDWCEAFSTYPRTYDLIHVTGIDSLIKDPSSGKNRFKEFQVGDKVMIRMRPEWFPSGTVKKLHARRAGPFKILKRISSNAYMIDIPYDMGISSTFNVEDLVFYHGPTVTPDQLTYPLDDPTMDSIDSHMPHHIPLPIPPLLAPRKEKIETILDHEVISTTQGGFQKFLVKWRDRPSSDATWITEAELQSIDPDLLEQYVSLFLQRQNLFS